MRSRKSADWDGHQLQAWAVTEQERFERRRRRSVEREYARREKVWEKRRKADGLARASHDDAEFLRVWELRMPGHTRYRYSVLGEDLSDLAQTRVACPACNDPAASADAGLSAEELDTALTPDNEVVHISLTDGFVVCYRCKARVELSGLDAPSPQFASS